MRGFILLLIAGFLFSQDYPALRVGEFTIVGIDTLRARRGIVDVIPGFRTSITIPDPDLSGFIVDKFPVKTIEVKAPRSMEKKSIFLTSFGFGYGNNLHFQLIAGQNRGKDLILTHFRTLGPAGGSKGITELEGTGRFYRRFSNSTFVRISAGIYSKWARAIGGSADISGSSVIPSFSFDFARFPVFSGPFIRANLGIKSLFLKSVQKRNKSGFDAYLEAGIMRTPPLKVSGVFSYRTLGEFSLTSGKIHALFTTGILKSSVFAGYAFSGGKKAVGGAKLTLPVGARMKFLLSLEKSLLMADYSEILRSVPLVSSFGRLDEEFFETAAGLNFTTGYSNIRILAGYRQFEKPPLIVRNGNFWSFETDTADIKGGILRVEAGIPDRFTLAGEVFIGGGGSGTDTLLYRGRGIVSFVYPEGKIIPGFKSGITATFFGDDIVITQGFEVSRTVAGNFGAFVELTNPVKEGFEIFTPPGYKISNGFSLTMGFTLKF